MEQPATRRQAAVAEVMNVIYEVDSSASPMGSLGAESASYSRRLGDRDPAEEGWVLDADIRGFFDSIVHTWMLEFLNQEASFGQANR